MRALQSLLRCKRGMEIASVLGWILFVAALVFIIYFVGKYIVSNGSGLFSGF